MTLDEPAVQTLDGPAVQAAGRVIAELPIASGYVVRLCRYYPPGTRDTINASGVATGASGVECLIRLQTGATAAGFAAEEGQFSAVGQRPTDLASVGDEAFSSTIGSAQRVVNTVIARKGPVDIQVTSSVAIDKEAALAVQLLG